MTEYKEPKIHAGHVECAVAKLIGWRTHTIVPNVSWGLGLNHECDMLILDSQERFTEVEIKVSASDLKADFRKDHGHKSKIISRLVYAMPVRLYDKLGDIIPKSAGIITVEWDQYHFVAYWRRNVRHYKTGRPDQKQIKKFMALGCMRIWTLKNHNNKTKLEPLEIIEA